MSLEMSATSDIGHQQERVALDKRLRHLGELNIFVFEQDVRNLKVAFA